MRSILLLPLVARCLETIDVCIWSMFLFYVCCSDCVGVCGNVCCVAARGSQTDYSQHTCRYHHNSGNITFTTTDIPSTTQHRTSNCKVHINNTKQINIANFYIPPRDSTSTQYKTVNTDIQRCIQYITNTPHSVLTGDCERILHSQALVH